MAAELKHVTPGDFDAEVLEAEGTSVVIFYMDRCPFCRAFKPSFAARADTAAQRLLGARVNEDENPFWTRFNIEAVPTMIAFRQGAVVGRRDSRPQIGLAVADLDSLLEELG